MCRTTIGNNRAVQFCDIHYPIWGILHRKKVNIILLISKELAHKLNKEYGIKFGENGISVFGKRRKYYLCESKRNMVALEKVTK